MVNRSDSLSASARKTCMYSAGTASLNPLASLSWSETLIDLAVHGHHQSRGGFLRRINQGLLKNIMPRRHPRDVHPPPPSHLDPMVVCPSQPVSRPDPRALAALPPPWGELPFFLPRGRSCCLGGDSIAAVVIFGTHGTPTQVAEGDYSRRGDTASRDGWDL